MITLKEVYQLNERADFQYVASELVKYYGLRSKIKFGVSKNKADYDFDNDIIKLRSSYPNVKDFIISVLHEIHHATQVKKYGKKKFDNQF